MTAEYDDNGEYKYPEGFDPETQEWKEGFETQREKWEQEYAAAQARWESHKKQVGQSLIELAEAPASESGATSYSSEPQAGALADDEALAALKARLEGN